MSAMLHSQYRANDYIEKSSKSPLVQQSHYLRMSGVCGLRKLLVTILRNLQYTPNLLSNMYYKIVRKKFIKRRNETNYGLTRTFNWIMGVLFPLKVDKIRQIISVTVNPVFNLIAFVSKDWLSFTFSICTFSNEVKSKARKTMYYVTSVPQNCNSLLLKWSPNGKCY